MVNMMIDPGHDRGKYNQSPVVPEYWEGERMWALAQRLRAALETRGIGTGCTKSRCDQAVNVLARGRMAKGYDSLLSLHSNAYADPAVDRPVGICQVDDNCGPIDEASKALARRLSKAVERVMGTRGQAEVYSRKSSADRDGDGYQDDWYGVLRGAHEVGVPAVILENGFHTNPEAAAWLLVDANLDKLAEALADELADYYGVTDDATPTQKEGTPVYMNTLRKGDKGSQVKALQALLIGYGYDCGRTGADGDFGAATDSAVRKYQSRSGLTVDGIVGAKTWAKLLGI